MRTKEEYLDFIKSKMAISSESGFQIDRAELTESLYPHVKDSVEWAIRGGNRAIFSSFGLMKTVTQLEIIRLILRHEGGKGLIVCPKGVISEFMEQATDHIGINVQYVTNQEEVKASTCDILITNYERVRDGDIEPSYFRTTSLDEASVLRSYGSKTYQTFLPKFQDVKYKFVATATPSPNRYKELIHYAGYLGVMDTGQALTRFFKRDSTKANNLTLYEHKEKEFWTWVSTWSIFITKPSDLGYSDEGFDMPQLNVIPEIVKVDNSTAGSDRDGQVKMFREAALGLKDAAKEKRDSIDLRIERMLEIINRPENKDQHFIIWHDLEAERHAICKAIPECKAVYGTQNDEEKDKIVSDFKHGRLKYLAAKPEMLGEGLNFQKYCHKAIFLGIDYEFNDKFQAIHRIQRFGQAYQVDIYLIYAESEVEIFKTFMEKWANHNKLIDNMVAIIRENGLSERNQEEKLLRYIFSKREEVSSKRFKSINNDCVLEAYDMPSNSVGLIVTSIPFSNHYEYTPTYNDFGHNINNELFWEQMDFLTPQALRVLMPGRLMCIHIKDRVLFGNATGTGMPTIDPFHAEAIFHYIKHGFQFMGMITVDTDVVRENSQTYRLGWTENCKDGSKMGVGCPEYVLLFRKLPTDTSNAYADIPVVKSKKEYSRARWQIDAHAHWKSSGDTLLTRNDLAYMDLSKIRRLFRKFDSEHIYDYEAHVQFAEMLDAIGILPSTFMVVDPVSKREDIWDDVIRMKTLNSRQTQKKNQNHICPLQIDIVKRLINRYSNKGDVVYDPFGGIQTVPYIAVKEGRYGLATELSYDYWRDGLGYLREAEMDVEAPTLFDLMFSN
jgi:DNA modification methylase